MKRLSLRGASQSALVSVVSAALLFSALPGAAAASPQSLPAAPAPKPVSDITADPKNDVAPGTDIAVTNTVSTPIDGVANGEMNMDVPAGLRLKSSGAPPAGWTLKYSTNGGATFGPAPADMSTVTNVKAEGTTNDSRAEGKVLEPLQDTGVLEIGGGGDGFNPSFYNKEIWVANHHESNQPAGANSTGRWLRCFKRDKVAAGESQVCDGFPAGGTYIAEQEGTAFGTGPSVFMTSNESVAFINRQNGRMYVPVQKAPTGAQTKTQVGWICGDIVKRESCGFTAVGTQDVPMQQGLDSTGAPNMWISMLTTQIWNRSDTAGLQYGIGKDGTVYCFNVGTGQECTGFSNPVMQTKYQFYTGLWKNQQPIVAVSGTSRTSEKAKYAWVIAPQANSSSSPTPLPTGKLACINLDTGANCSTVDLAAYSGYSSTSYGVPTPVYDTSGNFSSMCVQTVGAGAADIAQVTWAWRCFDTNGVEKAADANKLRAIMPPPTNPATQLDLPAAGNAIVSRNPFDPTEKAVPLARTWQSIPYIAGSKLYIPIIYNWDKPAPGVPVDNFTSAENAILCFDYDTGARCKDASGQDFEPPHKPFITNMVYTVAEDNPTCMWWQGDRGKLQAFDPQSGAFGCGFNSNTEFTVTPPPDCSPVSLQGSYYEDLTISSLPSGSTAYVSVFDKNSTLLLDTTITSNTQKVDLSAYPVSGDTSSLKVFIKWHRDTFIDNRGVTAQVTWNQPSSSFCFVMTPRPICPQDVNWTKIVTDATFRRTGVPTATGGSSVTIGVKSGADDCIAKLQKYVQNEKWESPPGVPLPVGAPVKYKFEVWTPGTWNLGPVTLVDDNATPNNPNDDYKPTYISGDTNGNGNLDPGERWIFESERVALQGVHTNTATLTVEGAKNNNQTSQANYNAEPPSIRVVKKTNGQNAGQPGLELVPGDNVTWTYEVTNTGRSELRNISLVDDKVGTISCPKTTLASGESMTCTATGKSVAGNYQNTATVVGEDPWGQRVTDKDDNQYKGLTPAIDVVKRINGAGNLDTPGGQRVPVNSGDRLSITFDVTNTGDTPLINISLTDVPSPGPITCPKTSLAIAERMTCNASITAEVGQHDNAVTVVGTGTFTNGQPLTYTDGRPYPNVTDTSTAGYTARQQLPIIVDPIDNDRYDDGYTTLIKDSSTSPQGVIKRRVFCRPFRPSAAGEIRFCRVKVTKRGAVKVRVQGYGRVKVTVLITAKPKPQYKGDWTSNSWRRTWILKGNTTIR